MLETYDKLVVFRRKKYTNVASFPLLLCVFEPTTSFSAHLWFGRSGFKRLITRDLNGAVSNKGGMEEMKNEVEAKGNVLQNKAQNVKEGILMPSDEKIAELKFGEFGTNANAHRPL